MAGNDKARTFASTGRSRRGEPWVWLTAAGLAGGLAMALGLLLLILFKGLSSFWPQRIHLMELKGGGAGPVMMAGHIIQERERRAPDGSEHEELQLFRGNKELSGEAFQYIDREAILRSSVPADLVWIERMEHGPAIGRLRALEGPAGRIGAGEPGFERRLRETLREAAAGRKGKLDIEKGRSGAVSRELEVLDRAVRSKALSEEAVADRRAALNAEFGRLRAEADVIGARLDSHSLLVGTADGGEIVIKGSELMDVFPSNRAGFFRRLGEAFHRVWKFLSEDPREANTEGGVFPAIFGTVVMTLIMSLFVTPLGVIAAIYLREYAKQGLLVRIVRICVNNLAGVPSIVFGVFGLAFFVYFVGGGVDRWLFADRLPTPTYGTPGILWASLTLALLTLPVVIVATEEALSAVPRGVREAALACGASKWQTIQRVVLPASLPGILTGVILAMARGAGEVAPLMLVGVVKLAPTLPMDAIAPFVHPERKFMHLGFHIYDLGFQSPDAEAAKPVVYATALLLIVVVVLLNLAAITIRNRIRRKFAVSQF